MELEPRTTAPAHATGAVEFVPLDAVAADPTFRLREEGDVSALAASIGRLGHLVPIELRPLPAPLPGGPRYQVVAGFRRLAALRLLARERVLARVHAVLDDDDAWAIALAQALLGEPLRAPEVDALRARLTAAQVAPWADELLDEALVRAPVEPDVRERFLAFLTGAPVVVPAPGQGEGDAELEDGASTPHPGPLAAERGEGEREAQRREGEPREAAAGPEEVTADELALGLAQRMFEANQDLALAFESWAELPEEGRRMIVEQARYVAELYPLLAGGRR